MLCERVRFPKPETVPLGVQADGEVAKPRYGYFALQHRSAGGFDFAEVLIDGLDTDEVGDAARVALQTFGDAAANPRIAFGVGGFDELVGDGTAQVGDLPSEECFVKGTGALGIFCGNVEVDDGRHGVLL